MQNTELISNEKVRNLFSNINSFFDFFGVDKILRQSNIKKVRGARVLDILTKMMELPFLGMNYYRGIVINKESGLDKMAGYDLVNNPHYNWRKLLLRLVYIVINQFLRPLTDDSREDVLILDDTSHKRDRSKTVELLAKSFDHVIGKFYKGFRIMTLGWSDGNSFMPVDYALLSSNDPQKRYQEMKDDIDKRSCGYKRRLEAISKSTELIAPMVKRAKEAGIRAKYLLMDSWYGMPAIIASVARLIDVICMVKNTPKIYYYLDGRKMTLKMLYKSLKKNRGRAEIKGSQVVEIHNDGEIIKVKIVFVKNRNIKKSWLAILSTDIKLADEEIVRIYGKRWDIEVFFKMIKHHLNLKKEMELRSFDGMLGHITIVFLRYIFLAVEQRKYEDDKTFGGVFFEAIEEMQDITIFEALLRIIGLAFNKIRSLQIVADDLIDRICEILMGFALDKYIFRCEGM